MNTCLKKNPLELLSRTISKTAPSLQNSKSRIMKNDLKTKYKGLLVPLKRCVATALAVRNAQQYGPKHVTAKAVRGYRFSGSFLLVTFFFSALVLPSF